jgi:iron(III) transport system substrate-binding protein
MKAKWSTLLAGVVILTITLLMAHQTVAAELAYPAIEELYKAAKAEKELVWQFTSDVEGIRPVSKAFQARYPGVKLTVISIGSATIGSRLITESSTHRLTLDVASNTMPYMSPLLERDLLEKHDWTKIVPGSGPRIGNDGGSIYIADAGKMWAYNTKSVSKAEAPKTLEDTLNPKWKGGKISLRGAHSGFINVWPLWKQDKQKAIDYMKRLAKQDFLPETRTAVIAVRIIRGECPIGMAQVADVFNGVQEGAPIAPCPMPAVAYPRVIFIPKGGVKHPNAAKLFMAWLLTPEGTKAFVDAGEGLLYPPEASKAAKWLADNGIGLIRIASKEDVDEYNRDFAEMVMKETGLKPE